MSPDNSPTTSNKNQENYTRAEVLKTKDQVLDLLERYPSARNNDFYLQWLWLRHYGRIPDLPFIEWEQIKHFAGRLETVRRVRQKIQNTEGRFLPTDPDIIKRRRLRSHSFREAIREA